MKWPVIPVCAVLFWTAFTGTAQRPDQSPAPYFKYFRSHEHHDNLARAVLKNGCRVIVEEQGGQPLVALLSYVRIPFSLKATELARVRFLQQVVASSIRLEQRVFALGGVLTIEVAPGGAYFCSVVPPETLRRALEIHRDLAKRLQLEPEQVREALLRMDGSDSEPVMEESTASKLLWDWISPSDGRLSDLLLNWEKTPFKSLNRELQRLHDRYFKLDNILLVVTGDVLRNRVLENVAELYAPLKSGRTRRVDQKSPTPPSSGLRYQLQRGDHELPKVWLAYPVPGPAHPDYPALLLLSSLLGEGRSGWLRGLVQQGSALEVECGIEMRQGVSFFTVFLEAPAERLDRSEVGVLALLEAIRKGSLSARELEKSKALFLRAFYEELLSLTGRSYRRAWYERLGSYRRQEELLDRIRGLDTSQIEAVVKRYFSVSRLALLEYLPRSAEQRTFSAEALKELWKTLVPLQAARHIEAVEARSKGADRVFDLPWKFTPRYAKSSLKKTSILRGPAVYWQEKHEVPLVEVGFFYPGGRIEESAENAGITELMLRTLLKNAGGLKQDSLALYLDGMGAQVEVVNEPDFFGFQASVLSNHLSELFDVLSEWAHRPVLEEPNLKQERAWMSLSRAGDQTDWEHIVQLAQQRFFGQHPYAYSRYGSETSLGSVTVASLQEWLDQRIKNVHPLIVIRGNFEGTSFLQDFISILSDSNYTTREVTRKEPKGEEEGQALAPVWYEEDGQQVLILPGPQEGSRAERVLDVVENWIRFSGSKSLGTSPSHLVLHQAGLSAGSVYVRTATGKGNQEPREAVPRFLRTLKESPIRDRELMQALSLTITRFYLSQQGRQYVSDLGRNLLLNPAPGFETRYISTIRSVSREDWENLLAQYLSWDT